MREALRSRAGYDWATHEATRLRNRAQIEAIPAPEYPAFGTARIGAVIAQARRRRDEAILAGLAKGGAGLRTATPADNLIPSAAPAPTLPSARTHAVR